LWESIAQVPWEGATLSLLQIAGNLETGRERGDRTVGGEKGCGARRRMWGKKKKKRMGGDKQPAKFSSPNPILRSSLPQGGSSFGELWDFSSVLGASVKAGRKTGGKSGGGKTVAGSGKKEKEPAAQSFRQTQEKEGG